MHIKRASDSGNNYFDDPTKCDDAPAELVTRITSTPREEPMPALHEPAAKWTGDSLPPDDERETIIQAKAGNPAAASKLFKAHHRTIRAIAGEYRNLPWEDRMRGGSLGFAKALNKFNITAKNRFNALLSICVRNAIVDEIRKHSKRGWKDLPASALNAAAASPPAQGPDFAMTSRQAVAAHVNGVTMAAVEQAQAVEAGIWHAPSEAEIAHASYNAFFNYNARAGGNPLAILSRLVSKFIEREAREADDYDARRLKEIGPQRYADERIAHEQAIIAARHEADLTERNRGPVPHYELSAAVARHQKLKIAELVAANNKRAEQQASRQLHAALVLLKAASPRYLEKRLTALYASTALRRYPLYWHHRDVVNQMPPYQQPLRQTVEAAYA